MRAVHNNSSRYCKLSVTFCNYLLLLVIRFVILRLYNNAQVVFILKGLVRDTALLSPSVDLEPLGRDALSLGVSGHMEFQEHLREVQQLEALTDREMADRIGCSRQLYNMTRTGKAPIGYKILEGAVRAFPELEKPALNFLITGVHHLKRPGRPSDASKMREGEQRRECARRILS